MNLTAVQKYRDSIMENCEKVILGKEDVIEKLIICFLCGGHVLMEDVPGTGKTMLMRAFAASVGGDFKRIQFTPDLLPSDLTGIQFYNQKTGEFEFRPGPLFSQLILADEINRATPRTQSALLEAMEEKQISADGKTMKMADPFMVMATQNPLESYGTFPLPEAQTDRFFMRLAMGYMNRDQEKQIIARRPAAQIVNELSAVVTKQETDEVRNIINTIHVSDAVASYIMDLIDLTRNNTHYEKGVSVRGGIALYSASQAYAAMQGREYVIPEDIKHLAVCILAHRIGSSAVSRKESESYIRDLLDQVPVPVEEV